MKRQLSNAFFVFLVLLLVYGISYYLLYLKYNDRDVTLLNSLNIENINLKNELNEIRNGLGIKGRDERIVISRVLRRNIYNFYNEVVITNDEGLIKEGLPVVDADGMVGVVSSIYDKECIVKLLTGDYNLSVKVRDSFGNLKNGMITMLDKYKEINVGDKVYTSGLTDIAGDILVGEIEEVLINDNDTSKIAKVKMLDNANLNYVGIVFKS